MQVVDIDSNNGYRTMLVRPTNQTSSSAEFLNLAALASHPNRFSGQWSRYGAVFYGVIAFEISTGLVLDLASLN